MQRVIVMLAATLVMAAFQAPARAAGLAPQWAQWNTSAVVMRGGYPVFQVDGAPFFVYGAAFFYERVPAMQWRSALQAYRAMGINTIDLYVIWNWHQPAGSQPPDFTGRTDPQRNLLEVLALCHELGFKIVLRPGPVIRNEWRNGGYPDWLLERPEYNMPLHDVLEGRYPATATLQNAHADAAAAEWLANATHLHFASAWLTDVLAAVAPYAGDVVAIALDDDQGAYIDNDTWPAPHWHAYIGWLRLTVQSAAGSRVPLFINTFESRVTAAAPAWAWGDWYQSDAYSIGEHDLSEIDFSTGLLATQPHLPVMMAEFQAGWLQGADEGAPRPADPANTTLALHEFLRDGAGGIVNFPVQDTVYPGGWEAPWANWSYAWDAALTSQLQASGRYAPTAAFGDAIQRYGPLLAGTHPAADAAIVWPPSLFSSSILTGGDYAAFRDATIAAQRACVARGLTCALVDVAYDDQATLDRYATIVVPISVTQRLENAIERPVRDRLAKLRSQGRLASDVSGISPLLGGVQDATLLLADDGSGRNFIDAINPSDSTRSVGPLSIPREGVYVRRFDLPPRSARIFPVGSATSIPVVLPESPPAGTPPPFAAAAAESISSTFLHVAIDPNAGARVAELSAAGVDNAASSIGLLRDAVEPSPPSSARDYIAPYTHPLPAGTFNRPYFCTSAATADETRVECTYDAPDLPNGGATFSRTYDLASDGRTLVVKERFAPRDATSTASLASVSGFAFVQGDTVVAPSGAPYVGILHGHRLAAISWQPGDVAAVQLRSTRGAELVSLTFAKRSVRLALGIYAAGDPAEAERLLQANAASRLR